LNLVLDPHIFNFDEESEFISMLRKMEKKNTAFVLETGMLQLYILSGETYNQS